MELYVLEFSEDGGTTFKPWTPEPCIAVVKEYVQSQVEYQTKIDIGVLNRKWRVGIYTRTGVAQ